MISYPKQAALAVSPVHGTVNAYNQQALYSERFRSRAPDPHAHPESSDDSRLLFLPVIHFSAREIPDSRFNHLPDSKKITGG